VHKSGHCQEAGWAAAARENTQERFPDNTFFTSALPDGRHNGD
jgi:hypothetical protein